ncbi:MAG: PQQ-binding-like beta-propeller repeat protein, partial [Candidatus Binatia bacterium]
MQYRIQILSVAFVTLAGAGVAAAQCPPDCPVKGGGGDTPSDCHVELASDAVRLNAPFYNPAKPRPAKEIRCFDGDPGCDLDGLANNSCTFDIDLCLRNADPSLPSCTPVDVTAVDISGNTNNFPGLAALQSAVDALLPATTNVCTTDQSVVVPLKGPTRKGDFKPAKFSFKTKAQAGTEDADGFKMVCVPRNWPAHGYDAANTRATPLESKITAANVASLVQKWWFVAPPHSPTPARGRAITSTVTVGQKMIYTSSWDGRVYGIDKKKGKLKWMFNTGAANNGSVLGSYGVQSSVTLTADGRVVVADSVGQVYCLDGKKGKLLWQADAATDDPLGAHAWSSPLVVNNRVFIGIASHDDAPCTRGNLVAFDLDTGVELWRQYTVPEKICYADTAIECSANADCGPGPEAAGSPCLLGDCNSNPDIECDISMTSCPSTFLEAGVCVGTVAAGECWL